MIETQSDGKRLSAIDGATSLGQLADDAVLALAHWLNAGTLDASDSKSLQSFVDWLDDAVLAISDPLDLVLGDRPGVRLDNFSLGVTGVALNALAPGRSSGEDVAALKDLRSRLLDVIEGRAADDTGEGLAATFEAVAKAMLTSTDLMLQPPARTAWTTTSVF